MHNPMEKFQGVGQLGQCRGSRWVRALLLFMLTLQCQFMMPILDIAHSLRQAGMKVGRMDRTNPVVTVCEP